MNTKLRGHTGFLVIGFVMISLCWGCAGVGQKFDDWQSSIRESLNLGHSSDGSSADKTGDPENFIHKTRWSWETLAYLAEWYTGDPQNSEELARLNPHVRADKLKIGSEIAIPAALLRTRKPMPQHYSGEYPDNYYTHRVRWPGESLSLISSWYTGSSKNWRKLAKANPRLNPNRIKGGDVVRIPPGMLKTRVPLPEKEAAKYTSHYFAHSVKKNNEKLEDIARRYTGSAANRSRLARANPDLNPDRLKKGDDVYIPKKLLISDHPVKKSTGVKSTSKPADKAAAAEPKTARVKDDDVKLFGPKLFPKQ
ncbi:MAG: LysM peptidoglycan-binding domain-containing protein [Desulfobacterales bacterium]|nr:LysM peptidoglycan-binding domain-containing protein [Desulfobacterales bacterium]